MNNYSLEDFLQKTDRNPGKRPDMPLVGLTTDFGGTDATIRERYYLQVAAAGGVPVLLPPVNDADVLAACAGRIDALVLTGGGDCDPRWAGEEPSPLLGSVNAVRDMPELLLASLARRKRIPVLGICRGMQMMAVAFGGHVAQDISLDAAWEREKKVCHSQTEARDVKTHGVKIAPGSILSSLYGAKTLRVNSFHHQTVDSPPPGFRVAAVAEDGTAEAVESAGHMPFMGVQWHPEWLGRDGLPLFEWLAGEARLYMKAKALHRKYTVTDSHCDTPMFFPEGADFTKRDGKIKVDLFKMNDGLVDAVTMAAYIPQPGPGQKWEDVAPLPSATPFDYANEIFDRTLALAGKSEIPVAQARTPEDVAENKLSGRKSLMLAVENALALGGDLSRVGHFKNRGAVYFTLCHNGDNQICDSARGSAGTWNGLSPFGRDVVREMNSLGVMIDLSHAGEKTFYDVLELSEKPVVCSHSNCRALCPHERNLTDGQMRKLASKGGVCQLTLYDGFVSGNPEEADILRFMEHVEHAARIMGTEHIGIGSDFDGDGGIRGFADESDMTLFTRQLLRRNFSDRDIGLILGGNWLRVMGRVQENNT